MKPPHIKKSADSKCSRRFLTAVFLSLVVVGTPALTSPVTAQCPMSHIGQGCWDWLGVPSDLPGAQLDQYGELAPWQAGDECSSGCYDIREGALVAYGWANPWNGGCGFGPEMRDEFRVMGPPEGSPITFVAELRVEGTIEGGGEIWGGLGIGGVWADDIRTWDTSIVSDTIALPLQCAAGEPLLLAAELGAAGAGYEGEVHASGELRFSELPKGAYVVSCQNYNLPVQVQHQTWGHLKSMYR